MGGEPSPPPQQTYDFTSVDPEIVAQAQTELYGKPQGTRTLDISSGTPTWINDPATTPKTTTDRALFGRVQKIMSDRSASKANPFLGVVRRGVSKQDDGLSVAPSTAGEASGAQKQGAFRRAGTRSKMSLLEEDTGTNKKKNLLGK